MRTTHVIMCIIYYIVCSCAYTCTDCSGSRVDVKRGGYSGQEQHVAITIATTTTITLASMFEAIGMIGSQLRSQHLADLFKPCLMLSRCPLRSCLFGAWDKGTRFDQGQEKGSVSTFDKTEVKIAETGTTTPRSFNMGAGSAQGR